MRRRVRAISFLLGAGLAPAAATPARAAQILVQGPAACLDPAAVADEVAELIGKPLATVADVDFRLQISERLPRGWRLRLETVDPRPAGAGAPAVLGTREIDGASCSELAEAASVAIAVSVRSIAGAAAPPEPPPRPRPPPAPAAPPQATPSLVRTPPARPSWHPAFALGLATATGALPDAALGVDVEGSVQRGALRLVGLLTWFGSEDVVGDNDTGGTFQLLLGGALGCWAPRWRRWTALGCGGLELGRLTGTGLGVAQPTTGEALWRAARVDLGGATTLGGNASAFLRAGVSAPLARPEFVLDGSQLVYRPSRVTGHLTAGLELGF